ncbi:hypothetical protein BDV10DRAFT_159143 [Aspergillus recurvatus]
MELTILGDNPPARRYLYFRFIIPYLHAIAKGNTVLSEKVSRKNFWFSVGRYYQCLSSSLAAFPGNELPPSLSEGKTFEFGNEQDVAKGKDIGMLLGADLRDAHVSSMKQEGEVKATDEE